MADTPVTNVGEAGSLSPSSQTLSPSSDFVELDMSPLSSPPAVSIPLPDGTTMTLNPWSKPSVTILLIGETGVGKTAFLDLLANMCAGRHPEQFVPMHIRDNELGGSVAGSQTKKPMLYEIIAANGIKVRILDTPGLADTRGIEWDKKHKASIASAIREETEVIDSVIILANGTQERLGVATQYALTVLTGMFPHSIIGNIAFVFTMFNFQRSALLPELCDAKMWTIENPLAQWVKFSNERSNYDEALLEDMQDTLSASYKKALRTINEFFQWHDERITQPVHAINNLYLMTTDIEAAIANVIARITQAEQKRTQLKRFHVQLSEQEQIKRANANYESIFRKPVYEHAVTKDHHTLCVYGGCYKNCHSPCGLKFTLDREELGFGCSAFRDHITHRMGGYACSSCGHSSRDHQHYRANWTLVIKEECSTDKAAKQRFLDAKTAEEKIKILHAKIMEDIATLEMSNHNDGEELSRLCERFGGLALSGSFAGHISSTIHLLEIRQKTMKEEGADEDALRRMDEHIRTFRKKKIVVENSEKRKRSRWGCRELAE